MYQMSLDWWRHNLCSFEGEPLKKVFSLIEAKVYCQKIIKEHENGRQKFTLKNINYFLFQVGIVWYYIQYAILFIQLLLFHGSNQQRRIKLSSVWDQWITAKSGEWMDFADDPNVFSFSS